MALGSGQWGSHLGSGSAMEKAGCCAAVGLSSAGCHVGAAPQSFPPLSEPSPDSRRFTTLLAAEHVYLGEARMGALRDIRFYDMFLLPVWDGAPTERHGAPPALCVLLQPAWGRQGRCVGVGISVGFVGLGFLFCTADSCENALLRQGQCTELLPRSAQFALQSRTRMQP